MVSTKHGKYVEKKLSNVEWKLRLIRLLQDLGFHGFGKLEIDSLLSVVMYLGREKTDTYRCYRVLCFLIRQCMSFLPRIGILSSLKGPTDVGWIMGIFLLSMASV